MGIVFFKTEEFRKQKDIEIIFKQKCDIFLQWYIIIHRSILRKINWKGFYLNGSGLL